MTLEADLARFLNQSDFVITRSGADSILIALLSEDIGPGDEVLLPVSICQKVVNAVLLVGAVPVLCDCDEHLSLDLEDAARRKGPRARALIAHHPHGYPQDFSCIKDFAKTHGLFFIEDCAQAVGASRAENPVGLAGDVAVYSFGSGKITPVGFGGGVSARDPTRLERMERAARCGAAGHDDHNVLGIDSSLSPDERLIFQQRLQKFDQVLVQREDKVRAILARSARGGEMLRVFGQELNCEADPVFHRIIIRHRDEGAQDARLWQARFRSNANSATHDVVQTAFSPAPFAVDFVNRRLERMGRRDLCDPQGSSFPGWRRVDRDYLFLRTCARHSLSETMHAMDCLLETAATPVNTETQVNAETPVN